MLRIRDNVDLKELEKFGFEDCGDKYLKKFYDLEFYDSETGMEIDKINRLLHFNDYYEELDLEKWSDTIYDLIQSGLVEKVEE